jgi:hypothetical protein
MAGMASELPVCFGGFSERMTAAVRSDGIFFTFFLQIISDGSAVIWLYDQSVGIFFTFPLNYFGRASRS